MIYIHRPFAVEAAFAAVPVEFWSDGPAFVAPADSESAAWLRAAAERWQGEPPSPPPVRKSDQQERKARDLVTIRRLLAAGRQWSEIAPEIDRTPSAARTLWNRAVRTERGEAA